MDRRQKKTRDAIFKAFASLLSEKNYNQITVQEIIDNADIGRTTFYSHFETKDFLLKELCEELFDHVIGTAMGLPDAHEKYSCGNASDSVYLHLINHLKQNDNNIIGLLSCRNNELFLKYFKTDLQKLIRTQFSGFSNPKLPEEFLINHISSTFVETVSWWISRNMKESPETITEYFLAAIEPIIN